MASSLSQSTVSTVRRTPEEVDQIHKMLNGRDTTLPLSVNALQVLARRYLLRTHEGVVTETPEGMFQRVAHALAGVERQYGANDDEVKLWESQFLEILMRFEFTPAGRTLANAGGPTRVVANCIVLSIEDSMESIFNTLKDASLLQQAGSGLGFPLHLLRPAGSITKRSFGMASGPVSFLNVYNTAFGVIKQQNRHGANMAVMRVDHPDILEFIHCKDHEGDFKNFNVSVGLTDEFMSQVHAKSTEPFLCQFNDTHYKPRRVTRDQNYNILKIQEVDLTATEIFQEIIQCAWKTGEPGCVFLDTVNKTNPLPGLGPIEACNPCGEQFLHDGDVCNLGSINLEKFVHEGAVDFERLQYVTRIAVRMLDNVVDLSDFPVERVRKMVTDNRRVGLGIMGWADMLYQLRIGYNTEEARCLAEHVMKCIHETAHETSAVLAEEKAPFPNWEKSVYAPARQLRRNAALTNIPPTGTISMMFDVSGGVEPYFALAYHYKGILDGQTQLQYVNKHLRRALEKQGIYSSELMEKIIAQGSLKNIPGIPDDLRATFVTSMDITAEDHIRMQAAFQKYCDNAISKTINFPFTATPNDVMEGYVLAWQQGLKGCTVYRDGSRQVQVLNLNEGKSDSSGTTLPRPPLSPIKDTMSPRKRVRPNKENGPTSKKALTYSTEGTRHRVTHCPDCNGDLEMGQGCSLCRSCGWSRCEFVIS